MQNGKVCFYCIHDCKDVQYVSTSINICAFIAVAAKESEFGKTPDKQIFVKEHKCQPTWQRRFGKQICAMLLNTQNNLGMARYSGHIAYSAA